MKKLLALILAFVVTSIFVACGNKNSIPQNTDGEDQIVDTQSPDMDSENKAISYNGQSISLYDYLSTSNDEKPVIMYEVSSIAKDVTPEYVYVFTENECRTYFNNGKEYSVYGKGFNLSLTLKELSELSDQEIIDKYEKAWIDGFMESYQIWTSDSTWKERLENGNAYIYSNEFNFYDLCIYTDASGNNVESEMLFLPTYGYGKRVYSIRDETTERVYDTSFDTTFFNTGYGANKDLYTLSNVYKFSNMNIQGDIGNVTFRGIDAGDKKLITRDNISLVFEDVQFSNKDWSKEDFEILNDWRYDDYNSSFFLSDSDYEYYKDPKTVDSNLDPDPETMGKNAIQSFIITR